jgi:hypothetical protein
VRVVSVFSQPVNNVAALMADPGVRQLDRIKSYKFFSTVYEIAVMI